MQYVRICHLSNFTPNKRGQQLMQTSVNMWGGGGWGWGVVSSQCALSQTRQENHLDAVRLRVDWMQQ